MRLARRWALIPPMMVAILVVILAACNPAPQTTPTPPPDPQGLLNKAAQEVQNAKSVHIKLQLTGAPSYVDPPLTPGGPGNSIAFEHY